MATSSVPRHIIDPLVRQLASRGVDYADARFERFRHESLVIENGSVKSISQSEHTGLGIRVLMRGSLGFACTPHLTPSTVKRAANQAITIAKASATINKKRLALVPVKPVKAVHRSKWQIDPFEVPLSKKVD